MPPPPFFRVPEYRLPCFGVVWHMHGPRPARRTLLPFTLAFGFGALAFYVATPFSGGCDPAISRITFGAGAVCAAIAATLGLLDGYRHGPGKPGLLHWVGIIIISLMAAAGTGIYAIVVMLAVG